MSVGYSDCELDNVDLIKFLCKDEVFSDTRRLIIAFTLFLMGEATLDDLCEVTELDPSIVLYHIRELTARGLVEQREIYRKGQRELTYSLTDRGVDHLLRYIRTMISVLRNYEKFNVSRS